MSKTNPTDHLINSPAKLKECARCKGWIYVAHVHGWEVKVEPTPLNLADEIAYRLDNRKIYQTFRSNGSFELMPRSLWHITKSDPRAFVLASHDCKFPTLFEPANLYPQPEFKEPNF